MDRLATETLLEIFQLVRAECGSAALTSCALCCRRWHAAALPVLYRDVVLTHARLAPFAASFVLSRAAPHADPLVRTLTIVLSRAAPLLLDGGNYITSMARERQRLWGRLRAVAALLAVGRMPRLTSFSLRLADADEPDIDIDNSGSEVLAGQLSWLSADGKLWLPRSLLAAFVAALPASCVSVEIDTKGHDGLEPGTPSAHLCDALRAILPRLRHLRLRVRVMCPAIFVAAGGGADESDDTEVAAAAPAAPALTTLVINCRTERPGYGGAARVCGGGGGGGGGSGGGGTYDAAAAAAVDGLGDPHNFYPAGTPASEVPPEARVALTRCLRRLHRAGKFPAAARLWLLDMQAHDNDDRSVYAAFNRRDVARDSTWALPFRSVRDTERDAFLVRRPDAPDALSFLWAVEALAGGETWVALRGGARVPPAAAAAAAAPGRRSTDGVGGGGDGRRWAVRPLPVQTVQEYRARFPRRSCQLWANERKTGMRLLGAVRRAGLTDTTPLRELTPAGWRRLESGDLLPLPMLPAPAPAPLS